MLFLDKATTFNLDHRAGFLRGASSPPLVVAGGGEGGVSLCRFTPEPGISRVPTSGEIGLLCPHPSEPLLALIECDSGRLVVLRFDGSPVFQEDPPRPPKGSPEWMTAGYTDCRFDAIGTYLLCAARASEDHIEVQLRETEGWSIVDQAVVADPFGGSAASFHSTARPDAWALWLAAGQDGQCVYWLTCDGGRLHAAIEPSLENTVPPAFSPGGDEFLTIEVPGPLRRHRFPQAELLGACESPFGADDLFEISLCYLDDTRALAGTASGRIAVVDTPTMRVVNEVVVEGHEPRPTEDYHPVLTGEMQLCTDTLYFERIGNHLIIVHALHHPLEPGPDGGVKFEEWRDGLLCFPVDYVLEQCGA
jgi:hypothetical protein